MRSNIKSFLQTKCYWIRSRTVGPHLNITIMPIIDCKGEFVATFKVKNIPIYINPIWGGEGCSIPPLPKISSKTFKMASKYPQISWLFIFLYDLSKRQKNGFFTVILGVLKGVVANTPPHQITFIFNPTSNRVNNHLYKCYWCVDIRKSILVVRTYL